MKNFTINFFAMSIAVWLIFSLIWGPFIVAYNSYHWPVGWLFGFSFVAAWFDTMVENNK